MRRIKKQIFIKKGLIFMKKTEIMKEFKNIIKNQEAIGTRKMYETGKPIEMSIARREAYDMALAVGLKNGYTEDAVAKIWDSAVDAIDADDGIYPDDDPRLVKSNENGSMSLEGMRHAYKMTSLDLADKLGISVQLLIALEKEEKTEPNLVCGIVDYLIRTHSSTK